MAKIRRLYESELNLQFSTTSEGDLERATSVVNYQAALRTVTYTDTQHGHQTAARTIGFTINDGLAFSNTATRPLTRLPTQPRNWPHHATTDNHRVRRNFRLHGCGGRCWTGTRSAALTATW